MERVTAPARPGERVTIVTSRQVEVLNTVYAPVHIEVDNVSREARRVLVRGCYNPAMCTFEYSASIEPSSVASVTVPPRYPLILVEPDGLVAVIVSRG